MLLVEKMSVCTSDGKDVKDVFGLNPCRGILGRPKNSICPYCECPAAGQNLECGRLCSVTISLNMTLNHNKQTKS